MKKIILITAIFCTPCLNANAQEARYSGGMKYTTLNQKPASQMDQKPLYNRKETATETAAQAKDALPKIDNEPEATTEKTSQETVWDKYKALASGQAKDESKNNKPEKPDTPDAPSANAKLTQAQEPQSATGITGIIQDYQRNKQKRSQMKSIRFAKPETPAVEKPQIEKPEVESE